MCFFQPTAEETRDDMGGPDWGGGGVAVIGQAFPEDVSRGQSRLTNAGVLDRPSESLGDHSGFAGSLLVELKTGTN